MGELANFGYFVLIMLIVWRLFSVKSILMVNRFDCGL